MKKRTIIKWSIISVLGLLFLIGLFNSIATRNHEVRIRNAFTQKYSERTAFYDKMYKIITQKSQITVKNDSSFRQNINIIMQGRKDAPNVFMKWITETNPNANYNAVSELYADLGRTIEAERNGFFVQEQYLQDIKMQHDNLLHQFPANILFWVLGTDDIQYTPITSSQTDEVLKTGKDDNIKLNLQ